MKTHILIALILLMCLSAQDTYGDRILIKMPTVQEETEYVWRTITDITFFEEHNYDITLPKGELIDELKEKSKLNRLTDEDYILLQEFMISAIFKESDYEKGFDKIVANKNLINKIVNGISKLEKDWEFVEFDQYEIKLTLYGPGGSYNPETGAILIYTTKQGGFKQYENPSNTIIHEIIHIGTEKSIMSKYNVAQPIKERIIDKMVLINFEEYLPEYRLQGFGDSRIDQFIKNKSDIRRLDKVVEKFLEEHPN